jgi:hypothetical protein
MFKCAICGTTSDAVCCCKWEIKAAVERAAHFLGVWGEEKSFSKLLKLAREELWRLRGGSELPYRPW